MHLGAVTCEVRRQRPRHRVAAADRRATADVLRANGLPADLDRGNGHSFRSLTEGLLDRLGDRPLDLVLLAHQDPDLPTREVAGCYLAHRCPGDPLPLSVTGQGTGAAFTALRLAAAMHAAGELTAGAVFVLDRASWVDSATDDAAVLLQVGDRSHGGAVLHVVDEIGTDDPATAVAAAATWYDCTTVLTGPGVARPGGHGDTGVWVSLAGAWPLCGRTLLADHDPDSGRLHLCVLDGPR